MIDIHVQVPDKLFAIIASISEGEHGKIGLRCISSNCTYMYMVKQPYSRNLSRSQQKALKSYCSVYQHLINLFIYALELQFLNIFSSQDRHSVIYVVSATPS